MPKQRQAQRDQKRIEWLEKQKLVIRSKIDVLETAKTKVDSELERLRSLR